MVSREPRRGNLEVIDFFQRSFSNNKIPVIIYEAPTGYGKTSIIPHLYASSIKHYFSTRLIHVAPLRSLVEHIYLKRLKGDLYHELKINGIGVDEIGYQMMGYGIGKSPYYFKKIITSTIDSFVFNVFKLPVAEMYKHVAHYETPRTNIMTSTLMLDEAHLYGGDPGLSDTSHMFTVLTVLLKVMAYMGIPVLLATATLPQIVISRLVESISGYDWVEWYRIRVARNIDGSGTHGGRDLVVDDREYFELLENIEWSTKIIVEEEVEKIIRDNRGKRILVVRNTPGKAIEVYKIIRKIIDNTGLIHGLMRGIDRSKIVEKLEKIEVLVGTQVIEVGVDIDFDILITDAASLPALIQRAGRIARKPYMKRKAEIYIIAGDGDKIYSRELVLKTLSELRKYENLDWRTPCTNGCRRPSVYTILDKIYSSKSMLRGIDENLLIRLWELALNPNTGFNDAKELYIEQCVRKKKGLIRTSLLIPIYFAEDPETDIAALGDYGVPLSIWRVKHVIEKDIVEREDNKYMVLVTTLGESGGLSVRFFEKNVLLDIIENKCPVLPVTVNNEKVLLTGLIGKIDKYNSELGLEL